LPAPVEFLQRLNVFKEIGDRTVPLQVLCPRLGVTPDALERLLLPLIALGLLRKTEQGYAVPEAFRPCLTSEGEKDLSASIAHMEHLQAKWMRLETSVRTGKPLAPDSDLTDAEIKENTGNFMAAMESLASTVAEELVRRFPLQGNEEILDLGCGPGTYFRKFLQTYPGVQATAVDAEDVIPITRRLAGKQGLLDRVTFIPGDFLELSFKKDHYHPALLSNVIHIYPPEVVLDLLRKVYVLLRPGGTLLINDFFTDETGTHPLWGALFSLNMLLNTEGGRNYRLDQGEAFLKEAGFSGIRAQTLCMDSTLLIGKKSV